MVRQLTKEEYKKKIHEFVRALQARGVLSGFQHYDDEFYLIRVGFETFLLGLSESGEAFYSSNFNLNKQEVYNDQIEEI